jgi:hypothetical protein
MAPSVEGFKAWSIGQYPAGSRQQAVRA